MKQFVILLVWAVWGALLVACTHDIHENGLENVTYNAVQDVDGNYYDAVQIGDQVWMRTNLRTKHFRDGGEIKLFNNYFEYCSDGNNRKEPGCLIPYFGYPVGTNFGDSHISNAYNYFLNNERVYGLLYNWYAVDDQRGLCPEGWHVPSDAERDQLEDYVESQWCYNDYSACKALASQYGWMPSPWCSSPGNHPEKNNVSGFGAVPAGYYDGSFHLAGSRAAFWSSTQYANQYGTYYRDVFLLVNGGLGGGATIDKDDAYSVRCLRD